MDNCLDSLLDLAWIIGAVAAVVLGVIVWKYGRRRGPLLLLLVPSLMLEGCKEDHTEDGWDTDHFKPHVATGWRVTPAGHQRDAGPLASVAAGYLTEEEIDGAIDAAFISFWVAFPEFGRPEARIHLTEDYVFFYMGGWVAGADEGEDVMVALFTRGTSEIDPGAEFIRRPPDANYAFWRFTAAPLVPALRHELLHRCIGDPQHARPEWRRL